MFKFFRPVQTEIVFADIEKFLLTKLFFYGILSSCLFVCLEKEGKKQNGCSNIIGFSPDG